MLEYVEQAIQEINTLDSLPESERTGYYDEVVAPLIEHVAASVEAQPDPEHLAGWLHVQSATLMFAVEGITEVTYELLERFPEELELAASSLPPEQRVRIDGLLREFRGEERFPASLVARAETASSSRLAVLAERFFDTPTAESGVLGGFVGTGTFESSRGFPVVQGRLTLLDEAGEEFDTYAVNNGGGARTYRTTNGPLPPGVYLVSNHRPDRTTAGMVLEGVGYSFDLHPTDGTEVFGRSLFRIHPDGNPRGTNGCLGVREPAARLRECERHIAGMLRDIGPFKLTVRY